MPSVSCPSCGEKGKIPSQFIGSRVKCAKCGNSFTVAPPVPKPAALAAVSPAQSAMHGAFIEVEGLDEGSWLSTAAAPAETRTEPEESAESTDFQSVDATGVRQYKILTRKDPWFAGKFDLERLEAALNHYARQGWAVKSMATPHIAGFSSEAREEIVILLER